MADNPPRTGPASSVGKRTPMVRKVELFMAPVVKKRFNWRKKKTAKHFFRPFQLASFIAKNSLCKSSSRTPDNANRRNSGSITKHGAFLAAITRCTNCYKIYPAYSSAPFKDRCRSATETK
mmetsp:Transcript_60509/g.70782  ORF Transcript_60509/g.70782 Transcript_60509/m.70782 type:complete len:121 (+) Transcript_60509:295-657(+)